MKELNGDHVPETEAYGIRFEPAGVGGPETPHLQGLVFIGTGLRPGALRAALDACLLNPGEPAPVEDDFPEWETYGIDDACAHELSPAQGHEPGHGPAHAA